MRNYGFLLAISSENKQLITNGYDLGDSRKTISVMVFLQASHYKTILRLQEIPPRILAANEKSLHRNSGEKLDD
jgi:hypothetical protein